MVWSYLPGGLHTFPDTKVTDNPGQQQTQGQLPAYTAQLVDTVRDVQNSSPAE